MFFFSSLNTLLALFLPPHPCLCNYSYLVSPFLPAHWCCLPLKAYPASPSLELWRLGTGRVQGWGWASGNRAAYRGFSSFCQITCFDLFYISCAFPLKKAFQSLRYCLLHSFRGYLLLHSIHYLSQPAYLVSTIASWILEDRVSVLYGSTVPEPSLGLHIVKNKYLLHKQINISFTDCQSIEFIDGPNLNFNTLTSLSFWRHTHSFAPLKMYVVLKMESVYHPLFISLIHWVLSL